MSSEIQGQDEDWIIDASGLGKCYHVYDRPSHRLLQGIFGDRKRYYREFWALKGVDLKVRRGETLGIIGRNGSGKSTLLQLIAGTLSPTEGSIRVRGRIAALLELGSGFNPDFTGRENVYLNASILGLTSEDVRSRMDPILKFADIGEFIDQPIRNYSSGMVMRLAFSVMAHVDADVLIIDEALAVGDAFFTQKCMRFLRDFKTRGTLLFVSHDDSAVSALCDKALWIDGGRPRIAGTSREVVQAYLQSLISARQDGELKMVNSDADAAVNKAPRHDARRDWINASQFRNDIEVLELNPDLDGFGEKRGRIVSVSLRDQDGRELSWVVGGENVSLEFKVQADKTMARPILGFYLKDALGQLLFGDNTYLSTLEAPVPLQAGDSLRVKFDFEMPRLKAGDYFFTIGLADGGSDDHAVQHWVHEALTLRSRCESWSIGILGLPMTKIEVTRNS